MLTPLMVIFCLQLTPLQPSKKNQEKHILMGVINKKVPVKGCFFMFLLGCKSVTL